MSKPRQFINSGSPWEDLAGYSRAVVEGNLIFVSGTIGMNLVTLTMPESVEAQTEQALDTVEAALRAADANLLDVVRVRVYVPQRVDVAIVSAILKKRLGAARATNTTICAPLAVEAARVEIEVTAIRHSP